MKCILNLAYVGVLRIYFKFANLGKVAYFSVWRFFREWDAFYAFGPFSLWGPLRPKKCEESEPNSYNSISYQNINFFSNIKYFLQTL